MPVFLGRTWTVWRVRDLFYVRDRHGNYLHRVLLGLSKGDGPVDHVNGDGLDNRRANLRHVDASQNQANRGQQRNNTSGHKGVCWDRSRNRWVVWVEWRGVRHFGGRFTNIEEAASKARQLRAELHGEYRRVS
jgi:HNH endonuclease/AP2 domain